MPAVLRFFKSDPNKLGRGRGVYYRRGPKYKGKSYVKDGGYYSIYSIARDKAIKAKGWKKHRVGLPATSSIKHTSDGILGW